MPAAWRTRPWATTARLTPTSQKPRGAGSFQNDRQLGMRDRSSMAAEGRFAGENIRLKLFGTKGDGHVAKASVGVYASNRPYRSGL